MELKVIRIRGDNKEVKTEVFREAPKRESLLQNSCEKAVELSPYIWNKKETMMIRVRESSIVCPSCKYLNWWN